MMQIRRRSLVVLFLAALVLIAGARIGSAYGVHFVNFPPVPPAPQQIGVDGKLDEWKGIEPFTFNPLGADSVLRSANDPALSAMLQNPPSVSLRTCYDSTALYVAVEWKDTPPGTNTTAAGDADHWADGGEGLELHILTDSMLHVACWPVPGAMSVMARYDNDTAWRDGGQEITSVGVPGANGTFVEEIRIPWDAITKTRKMPTDGKIELGADFCWNAINAKMIESLRRSATATNSPFPGEPFCFLSSHVPRLGEAALMNSFEWGTLGVGDPAAPDQAVKTPEQTSLKEMPLVTALTPPAVDGTLTGWDPNGFQTAAYLPGFWGTRYTSHVSAQFDAQNLYLAAHFTSSGTFSNIKAESSQQGFGGGDALQIRLNNGSKTVNLCGWFDTQGGKPALTADGRDLKNPFLLPQGAKEQFKADADGKGYVQEISVPWTLLFDAAPTAPQRLKASFQFWFADLTPRFSLFSRMTLQRRGGIAVSYKMPAEGQLTLGLFDKAGKLLKWLVQDEYRYAGQNNEFWDGLDQWGNPVAAGDYNLKAVYHPPITLDYQVTVCNPGTPSWPTPDDKGDWLSDESTPQAVATDGKWVFLAAAGSEKGFSVMGLDEKGQRQWGLQESFNPRSVSLAVAGDDLYILFSGPEITDTSPMYNGSNAIGRAVLMCLDKKTGKPVKFTRETTHLKVATWPYREALSWLWDLRNNKSFSPFTYGGQPRYSNLDIGESTDALGMAVVGGKIYISMAYENKLLVLDADSGKSVNDDVPIDSPAGLCVLNDHTLLAVSGTKIMNVDLAAHQITPFISNELVAPDSIAVDNTGKIYVSDWGTSFQVKQFDPSGKLIRAIGKPGGRPWVGTWDPNGMLVPRGVAVADDGKLWVAEDDGTPERISLWDTTTGVFFKDYIGPTPYGGGLNFWIDPKDVTEVHAEGARFKVDYDKKTYTPEAIDYRKASINDPFTPNGHDLGGYQVRILTHGGHEYAFFNTKWNMLSILQRQGDSYKAVAGIGTSPYDPLRALTPDSDAIFTWDSDIMNHSFKHYYPSFFAGHMDENYAWSDTNGDNQVQPDEMQWIKTVGGDRPYDPTTQTTWARAWTLDISPDFSLFFAERFRDQLAIMRLDVKDWTKAGAPIYDLTTAKLFASLPHDANVNSVHVTKDNRLVVAFGYEGDDSKHSADSIECFDMDGKLLWGIAMPKLFEGKNVHANCIGYDFIAPGIGDVVCTWLYHGSQKPFFFTTDGLYVGTALEESLLGPAAIWSESARYFYQAPDGTPYIVNGANQQEHIFKMHGFEKGGRFEGTLSLAQPDIDLAASLRDIPEVVAPPKPIIRVSWLNTPPVIDGNLADWKMNEGVSMDGGKGRTADVTLGRDKDNLYLAYQVHEPTPPLVNGGGDWHDLYVSGDCVDLMLATDPKADSHRHDAAVGDERLLFSVYQGQPIAVLYKPVVPGTTAPIHLAAAQVDQIIRLDSAKVAVTRDATAGTYSIEASVPLKDLSIDPGQKTDLQGDVGVIYADDSGKNRAQRLYYYNKDTQMVADLPTETRLQPSDWGTIEFPLGPNLLQNGSFEDDFVDNRADATHGWFVSDQANGADVSFSTDGPHSGHRSLLLEEPVPVSIPSSAYDNPDYDAFIKSINFGKGRGHAEIMQKVPVIGGHQYSVRYFVRAHDMQWERKETGHPRGYIVFGGHIEWTCTPPNPGGFQGVGEVREDHDDWLEMNDYWHGYDLPHPYVAPPGAVSATLYLELVVNAEAKTPQVFLDDVELVDVTPPESSS
jgi:hypothetical protein